MTSTVASDAKRVYLDLACVADLDDLDVILREVDSLYGCETVVDIIASRADYPDYRAVETIVRLGEVHGSESVDAQALRLFTERTLADDAQYLLASTVFDFGSEHAKIDLEHLVSYPPPTGISETVGEAYFEHMRALYGDARATKEMIVRGFPPKDVALLTGDDVVFFACCEVIGTMRASAEVMGEVAKTICTRDLGSGGAQTREVAALLTAMTTQFPKRRETRLARSAVVSYALSHGLVDDVYDALSPGDGVLVRYEFVESGRERVVGLGADHPGAGEEFDAMIAALDDEDMITLTGVYRPLVGGGMIVYATTLVRALAGVDPGAGWRHVRSHGKMSDAVSFAVHTPGAPTDEIAEHVLDHGEVADLAALAACAPGVDITACTRRAGALGGKEGREAMNAALGGSS